MSTSGDVDVELSLEQLADLVVCGVKSKNEKNGSDQNEEAVEILMNQHGEKLTRTEKNTLVETGSHEVRGSIPLGSTKSHSQTIASKRNFAAR